MTNRAMIDADVIDIDGVSLEYAWVPGRRRDHTLVLLHEGLGCVALWRDFPARLAEQTGCSVLAYSRAGYGGSDAVELPRPLSYMTDEARDVLPVVVRKFNLPSYSLLGHSDGASIALAYAGLDRRPGLNSLIVMAPHVFCEAISVSSIAAVNDRYRNGDLRVRLGKYHGSNVDCAFRGWCDSWLNPGFLQWSIEPLLGQIKVPILQIQGMDDEYGTAEQLIRIENLAPADVSTKLLDDCGHAPQFDQPDATIAAITDFLN